MVLAPVVITGFDDVARKFRLSLAPATSATADIPSLPPTVFSKAYAETVVQARLHQAHFRRETLSAYHRRCCICELDEGVLLDAAHIVPDRLPEGVATVNNGLCMCPTHHRAFDTSLLVVKPTYEITIARDRLQQQVPTTRPSDGAAAAGVRGAADWAAEGRAVSAGCGAVAAEDRAGGVRMGEPVRSNASSAEASRYATSVADHHRGTWPKLVDRLVPRFGAYAREPDEAPGVFVLNAHETMTAYATCGMSNPGSSGAIELHVLMRAGRAFDHEAVHVLAMTAHFHQTGAQPAPGHTASFGIPWLPGSACTHGLVSLPCLFGPDLEWSEDVGARSAASRATLSLSP